MFFETILAGSIRYAYARSTVLAQVFRERVVVDAVSRTLAVPIATGRQGTLSDGEAREALRAHVVYLRGLPTSPWYGVPAAEIAAAALFRSDAPVEAKHLSFPAVACEDDLSATIASYMRSYSLNVYAEVPVGRNRVDLLGRRDLIVTDLVAVELKNTVEDFKRGTDQLTTYACYAHEVWVACTPHTAAAYLNDHSRGDCVHSWDPKWLDRKLDKVGAGLLLVEEGHVVRVRGPRTNWVTSKSKREIRAALTSRTALTEAGGQAQTPEAR